MVMYIPLALAVLLVMAWVVSIAARRSYAGSALALLVGASLSWATTVHLGDDVNASRIMRRSRQDYLRELRPFLADRSAIFATGGVKDALGPLQLELDVVIAVPGFDQAATTGALLDAFSAQGRRVFMLPNALPQDLFQEVLAGRQVRYLGQPKVLVEVRTN
jgi:4-amino-4-deoxy-L-arabinose transferase-like glycosyltransferase